VEAWVVSSGALLAGASWTVNGGGVEVAWVPPPLAMHPVRRRTASIAGTATADLVRLLAPRTLLAVFLMGFLSCRAWFCSLVIAGMRGFVSTRYASLAHRRRRSAGFAGNGSN
jgi:hypothetical protein